MIYSKKGEIQLSIQKANALVNWIEDVERKIMEQGKPRGICDPEISKKFVAEAKRHVQQLEADFDLKKAFELKSEGSELLKKGMKDAALAKMKEGANLLKKHRALKGENAAVIRNE